MSDTTLMNDINLEIVHEVNVRYWQRQFGRLTSARLMGDTIRYLLVPAIAAWFLA